MAGAMAKKKTVKPTTAKISFERALEELEAVVADLEGGELGLEDALEAYQRGVERLKLCQGKLEAAERRIELLSGVDAQGNPITQPFAEGSDDSLEGAAANRSRKRGARVDEKGRLF